MRLTSKAVANTNTVFFGVGYTQQYSGLNPASALKFQRKICGAKN